MQLNRSSYRYISEKPAVDDGHQRVVSLSQQYSSWGYRKIYDLMKGEGHRISRERVRLIRRREGLQVVKKRRKRKVLGMTVDLLSSKPNRNRPLAYYRVSLVVGAHAVDDPRLFRARCLFPSQMT